MKILWVLSLGFWKMASLLTCNFEDKDPFCGFTQDITDDFDWLRGRGQTPSSDTGPSTDHTLQNNLGHYMYIESSNPRGKGDKARLISSFFNEPTLVCLKFYYNMYGAFEGTLNVYTKNNESIITPVLSMTGNHGNGWDVGIETIPLSTTKDGFQVVFEGVIGTGFQSDMAIDDVSLMSGPCQNSLVPFHCGFESEDQSCGFTQDTTDDFDWTRKSGHTETSGTGPETDHTIHQQHGHYMYTESSYPRRSGDKARLISQPIAGNSTLCLRFYYNMYGIHTGTLNVYTQATGGHSRPSFSLSGNQGNQWKLGQVDIPLSTVTAENGFKVVFECVIGFGYRSDMAIDDVSIRKGQCDAAGKSVFKDDRNQE